jgi:hypothetical protein
VDTRAQEIMMALTYEQSADLMKDAGFISRVKVACLTYANYISGEAASVPAHNTRIKWMQQTFAMPDATAGQITPVVVMDAAVQQDGAAVTDPVLQSAVENAVNKML